jgi:hypothetical protein
MICGAEACNLGAMIHGAKLRVHFFLNLSKKDLLVKILKKS